MNKKPEGILPRVNTLAVGDKSVGIYDDWASFYESDLLDKYGYVSPKISAEAFYQALPDPALKIIDYGCGTGLVGQAMQALGYRCIDGIDISEGMLAQARSKNVYQQLFCGDLTQAIDLPDEHYDGGLCVGSMGAGHIDAGHVQSLLQPIKNSGLFVLYMNDMHYQSEGFADQFKQLEARGVWRIERQERSNYMSELDRPGWLVVAYKLAV